MEIRKSAQEGRGVHRDAARLPETSMTPACSTPQARCTRARAAPALTGGRERSRRVAFHRLTPGFPT
ncbi:hypothetical protein PR003_g11216 [Phytophthora rubi]|uniref:Uncharacterized protein n=1 Tax=Phytophthora rubi TaxID=129364 RepID=A0A6A4F3N0_9STRA|nr:hypothetical protein PR003_g11216 [Phytophthora rubi]